MAMLPRLSPAATTCTTEGAALTLGCGPGVSRAGRGMVGNAATVGGGVGVGGGLAPAPHAASSKASPIAAPEDQIRRTRRVGRLTSFIRG
jgi:hypothetical protein